MGKLISYSNNPSKAIQWKNISEECEKIEQESISDIVANRVREIHIIGSKKNEDDYEIDDSYFGYYYSKTQQILIWICSYKEKEINIPIPVESVKCLDIRFTSIEVIDISAFKSLNKINLCHNSRLEKVEGLELLNDLVGINISNTLIEHVPSLDLYDNLKMLNISYTRVSELAFTRILNELTQLLLSRTKITDYKIINQAPNLKYVSLSHTKITGTIIIENENSIDRINLEGTEVENIVGIEKCSSLTSLNISYTGIRNIDDIRFPKTIRSLILDGMPINRIPKKICKLKELRKLSLIDLHLESLPTEIIKLDLMFVFDQKRKMGINLYNTQIDDMNVEILNQPREIIKTWFVNRKGDGADCHNLNETKVVFLGDGGAGKTLSISRLLDDCKAQKNFDGVSTPGISIQDIEYIIGDEEVVVHFWDFGGQEIMHSMHRMFLTRRTLYVVFINARDNTQDERSRYWLHNIKSFADNSPVILVINQMDQNPSASVNETSLRRLYPAMSKVVKISALKDSKKVFEKSLKESIIESIRDMDVINSIFLNSWIRLKERLQCMDGFYINRNEFMKLCDECGVDNNETVRIQLLEWFSDLGISFCYTDSKKLSDYMVLRPDWITNAIYTILFNGSAYAKNGILAHNDVYDMLSGKEGINMVENIVYKNREIEYVLGVIRRFKLSYLMGEEEEFVPMLCDRNEPAIVEEFMGKENVLEFKIIYDYLPINVLHNVMVEMRHDLCIENVWLTGAMFQSSDMGLTALIKSEDNTIKIYVMASKKLFNPNVYLGYFIQAIHRINDSMGLVSTEKIVYKEGNQQEEFDYKSLLESYEYGNRDVYASKLRKNIKIENIIALAESESSQLRKKLRGDLISVLEKMQANNMFYNCSEDERNTYIRDGMRLSKYLVSDQTLIGKSQSGIRSGELDIEIFKEANIPLTLMEALIIKSDNGTSKKYWNDHLKKLIDNYNPVGIPDNYLISYVECSKEKFKTICVSFIEHARQYTPNDYKIQKSIMCEFDTYYIQGIEIVYDIGGISMSVCEIFVRIGE